MMETGLCPTAPPTACALMPAAQQRAVCRRLPIRNFEQALPDAPSEIRTDQMQRRREIRLSACKIDIQPARRFIQNRRALFFARFRHIGRKIFRAVKPESRQSRIVRGEQHAAQRGIVMPDKSHSHTSNSFQRFRQIPS